MFVEYLLIFQFYNSPIKTYIDSFSKDDINKFQFYNSPIKTIDLEDRTLYIT